MSQLSVFIITPELLAAHSAELEREFDLQVEFIGAKFEAIRALQEQA